MKILLDSCVWGGAKAQLEALGHDVIWAGDWPEDPGDEAILSRANDEKRVLITLDKDFGELAVVFGRQHCGIIRVVDFGATVQAEAAQVALTQQGDELAKGALITVEPGRMRIRPPG